VDDVDVDADEPDVEETVAGATAEGADVGSADGTPVEEIKGIGPAYSDRLDEVGIHTVDQLAAADPADLAERTTVSEKTVSKWVDRATDHDA